MRKIQLILTIEFDDAVADPQAHLEEWFDGLCQMEVEYGIGTAIEDGFSDEFAISMAYDDGEGNIIKVGEYV